MQDVDGTEIVIKRPAGHCYSPGLEHNRCQAGHPIHYDTTGRYEADTWVHCLIADVVACPHDTEQILDVRPGELPIEAKARQAVEARTYVMPEGSWGPGMGGIR